jgi:hypothetical protein
VERNVRWNLEEFIFFVMLNMYCKYAQLLANPRIQLIICFLFQFLIRSEDLPRLQLLAHANWSKTVQATKLSEILIRVSLCLTPSLVLAG